MFNSVQWCSIVFNSVQCYLMMLNLYTESAAPVLKVDAHGAHMRGTKESWGDQKAGWLFLYLFSVKLAGLFSNKCIRTELEYMQLWREVIEHRSRASVVYLIADIYISISTETFDIENIKYEKTLATVRFRYILWTIDPGKIVLVAIE